MAVRFFNKLLRDEKGYWSDPDQFKSRIQWSFHHTLTEDEFASEFDLRSLLLRDGELFWPMVGYNLRLTLTLKFFRRLQQLSRVKLTDRMNRIIEASKGSSRIQLLSIDITNISTKVCSGRRGIRLPT